MSPRPHTTPAPPADPAQALRWSEERYRNLVSAILRSAADGIVTMDATGTIESVNPSALRMFGYEENELLGQPVTLLMPSPHREEHPGYVARYLATKQSRVIGSRRDVLGRRKDGSVFPLELSISEANWDDHLVFAGILRDGTERERLEEEFRQAQKMEAVGRLAGGIAHDFNNLLMGILGCCQLALSALSESHPARSLIEDIRAEAERGAGLTKQLLAFSRHRKPTPKPCLLNEIVGDAQRMICHLVGVDIEVRVELAAGGAPILADRSQIEQVLMNLVVNARDAMPAGGVLTMTTRELATPELGGRGEGGGASWVALTVADTGTGMDRETQAKIFDPFFTTKGASGGTGLGLSTAYGIVRGIGGRIDVRSAPAQGSTFTVWLPRHAAAAREAAPAPPARGPRGGGETILLVEDHALLRAAVSVGLEKRGYRVLQARDAAEALQLAGCAGSIDLLLTDVVMPGMSGPALATELARTHPRTAALFMSAYPRDYLLEQGRLQAHQPSLEKPFTDGELASKVRELLDRAPRA